jgi:hypothetical protein
MFLILTRARHCVRPRSSEYRPQQEPHRAARIGNVTGPFPSPRARPINQGVAGDAGYAFFPGRFL